MENVSIEAALRSLLPEPKFDGVLFTRDDYEQRILWADERRKPGWDEIATEIQRLKMKIEDEVAAKEQALRQADEARSEYGLTAFKNMSLLDLQTAVREQLAKEGGIERAIEQLAIAVSLLERRVYGKL